MIPIIVMNEQKLGHKQKSIPSSQFISWNKTTITTLKMILFFYPQKFPHPHTHLLLYSIFNHRQTYHDGRFYELRITCTDNYPAEPPIVKFISKVNMTCVDPRTGLVQHSKLPAARNWNRNLGIEQILSGLRREMCTDSNRRLRQPEEGLTFQSNENAVHRCQCAKQKLVRRSCEGRYGTKE